jgi:hypothetical protein
VNQVDAVIEIVIWPGEGADLEGVSTMIPVAAMDVQGKTPAQIADIVIYRITQFVKGVLLNATGS